MNNIVFEEIKVKMPELRTWFGDREIYLSLSQLRLLMILLSDPSGLFTYRELIARADLTTQEGLAQLVLQLRRKLNNKYIINIPALGYVLTERKR